MAIHLMALPSTGIPPWILDLCPVCLHAGALLFLHRPLLIVAYPAEATRCCRAKAHPILLARDHSLLLR